MANLRGGGELGDAWHRSGMKQHKTRVFEDMEAVLRFFSSSGISQPRRIALTGGSNGGLLVGALITRAPELFGAAAAYVGLYDMVRFPLFPPAALWTSEYGDPREPAALRYLHAHGVGDTVEQALPRSQQLAPVNAGAIAADFQVGVAAATQRPQGIREAVVELLFGGGLAPGVKSGLANKG